jgi:hypothetical protein
MLDVLVNKFKDEVARAARNPAFAHHKWYVQYHLEFAEKIALELSDIYADADRSLIITLVWLHDYGKILGLEQSMTPIVGRKSLVQLGFPPEFIERAVEYAALIDKKVDLVNCPIEVRIVSSADGASHLVGPFYFLWWYENHDRPISELIQDNLIKARIDWNRKIVLPEVREHFKTRYETLLGQLGVVPGKFLEDSKS